MTPEYKAVFFNWHGNASSAHNADALTEFLNTCGEAGWALIQMQPISIGFLLVFKKPA